MTDHRAARRPPASRCASPSPPPPASTCRRRSAARAEGRHRPLPRPRRVADRGAGGRGRRPPRHPRRDRGPAQRRRGLRPRDHPRASKAPPSSTCSPPAARATSRGCRWAAAPAPSSTPPRSSSSARPTTASPHRLALVRPHVRALARSRHARARRRPLIAREARCPTPPPAASPTTCRSPERRSSPTRPPKATPAPRRPVRANVALRIANGPAHRRPQVSRNGGPRISAVDEIRMRPPPEGGRIPRPRGGHTRIWSPTGLPHPPSSPRSRAPTNGPAEAMPRLVGPRLRRAARFDLKRTRSRRPPLHPIRHCRVV